MKTFSLSWFAFGSAARRAMFFAVAAVLGLSSAAGAEVFIGNMVFGSPTNYTLPVSVTRIVVEVTGAGGDGRWEPDWSATGGNGGYATASYAVSGGQVISVNGNSASISGGFQIYAEDGTSAYEEDGEHYNGTDGGAYFDPGHGYIANSGSVGSAGNGSNGSSGDLYGGQGSVVIGLYTSQAPVITSALTGSYNAGTYFIYQITASGAPTSFNVVGLPSTCTFNPATGQIMVYLPTAGTTSFTVQATNAIGTGQATVTWNVSTAPAPEWQEIYRASGSIWTETDEDGGYHGSSDWHGFTAPAIGTIEVNVTGTANTQDGQQGQFRFNFSGEPGLSLSATMDVRAGVTGAMIWGEPGWTAGDYEIVVRFRAMNLTPPTFTEQPATGWYAPYQSVSFHVAAVSYPGATIAYQWQRLPAGGGNWTNITDPYYGATTPTLTFTATAAMNGDQFRCVATNAVGATTSNAVPLSLATAPVFTTQPQNQTVVRPNESFSFTVAASGPPVPQYQWFRWYPGRGWDALIDDYNHSGTHSATLTVTHDSSYPESSNSFLCTATTAAGTASSLPAIRTYVDPPSPPQFVSQPWDINPATYEGWPVFFYAGARGSPAVTYQWESSATGLPPWSPVPEDASHWGTKTSWLWVNPTLAMHGTRFRCVATNTLGTDTSRGAMLLVQAGYPGDGGSGAPTISRQPVSQTVGRGTDAVFLGGVTGSSPITFQWFKNGAAIIGATNVDLAVLSAGPSDVGSYYFTARNSFGAVTSATATLGMTAEDLIFPPLPNRSKYAGSFQLAAKSVNGLPVSFSVIANPNGVVESLNGSILTLNSSVLVPDESLTATVRAQTVNEVIDRSFKVSNRAEPGMVISQQQYSPPPPRHIDDDGYLDEIIPAGFGGFEVEIGAPYNSGSDDEFDFWIWSPFWPFGSYYDNVFGRSFSFGFQFFSAPLQQAELTFSVTPDDEHQYFIFEDHDNRFLGNNQLLAQLMENARNLGAGITKADCVPPSETASISWGLRWPDSIAGSNFFLVKDGKPVGMVQVSLPGQLPFTFGTGSGVGTIKIPGIANIRLSTSSLRPGEVDVILPDGRKAIVVFGSIATRINISPGISTPVTPGVPMAIPYTNTMVSVSGNIGVIDIPNVGKITVDILGGGGRLELPNGVAVIVSRTGKVDLSLPAGSIINEVLKKVTVLGAAIPGNLQVEVDSSGQLRAGIKVGENQTLWFNVNSVSAPIEFVRGDVVLPFARIGHWGADRADGGVDGYAAGEYGGILKGPPPDDFIDKDPERFYIRVTDPSRNQDPNQIEKITVSISTILANANVDDAPTSLTLEETGNNTGVFVSESQLLASEDIPDEPDSAYYTYSKYSDSSMKTVLNEEENDRIHRATVDGYVKVQYQAGSQTYSKVIPVCRRDPDERKVLNVVVHTFNEPWQDINGNGVYDLGEPFIDISTGATAFGTSGTRGRIWTDAEIDKHMKGLRGVLAQARIRVVEVSRVVHEPKGNLFAQSGTVGYFNCFTDITTGAAVSRDHAIIQTNFRSPQQFNSNDDDDVVDIYFVPKIIVDYGSGGTSFYHAMQFRPGYIYDWNVSNPNNQITAKLINQVFVSIEAIKDNTVTTLAHEMLHQLTNRPDQSTPLHIVFPSTIGGGVNDGSKPEWRRRIQEATAIDARRVRSNLNDTGNLLLRNP